MIKKTIQYEDYNGETVSEDFYFNFTKLELAEKDLELGGLESVGKRLSETEDAPEAYKLFKKLLLDSYGVKSADGRRFEKSEELRKDFEASPAIGELILELIQDAAEAANFFKQLMPASLIRDIESAEKKQESSTETPAIAPKAAEPTDEELLKMSPQDMTPEQLKRAYTLKTQS